ncbi:MAG: hypothetical protein WBF38_00870 [Nitrosotalea sp.]
MNADEIITRKISIANEIIEELKNSKSPRIEILLATNYSEFILKNFMEFLLQSGEARRIPRDTITDILEDRKIIDKELADDIRKLFHIRDAYAHKPSLNEANEYVEKQVLPNLNCVKKESPKFTDWDKRPLTQKIFDACEWIFVHLDMRFHDIVEPIDPSPDT